MQHTAATTRRIYISSDQRSQSLLLEVLPAFYLEQDSDPADPQDLTACGWRYAEFPNTDHRVLVNITNERRWSSGWGCYVYIVQVRDVDTVANSNKDGICAGLGEPRSKMVVRADFLKCIDHSTGLMNWRH